jgi:hypothetical protein
LDYLNGILEDLKVYDRALSSSEVSDLFNGIIVEPDCVDNSDCDNGLFCDGAELCMDEECINGPSPNIDDEVDCTVDSCDEDNDLIIHQLDDSLCDDDDENTIDTCDAIDDCFYVPIGTFETQNIDFDIGWNIVSLNLTNSSLTSEDFDSIYVMRYNDGWETDWNEFSGDSFSLEALRGYYVYSSSAKNLTFSGTSISSEYSLIENTWNLISVNNTVIMDGFLVSVKQEEFIYTPVLILNPGSNYWVAVGDVMFGPPFYEGLSFDTFESWLEWLFSY